MTNNSSICLEELGPDGVITRCLHVYHRSCLLLALVAKNPPAANDPRAPGPCPNCAYFHCCIVWAFWQVCTICSCACVLTDVYYTNTGRQPVPMGEVLAQAPPEAKAEVEVEEEDDDDSDGGEEGGKGAGGVKYVQL